MTILSYLEPFSLPELFRDIEAEHKSGRLIVKIISTTPISSLKGVYFIWFHNGYLVAISDRINHRGLIELIENLNFLSPLITRKLRTLCPPKVPLGIYLHKRKLLTREKLSLIFQLQLKKVYQLFQLESGQFQFDELFELDNQLFTIPWLEMTGNCIMPTQASMYALRGITHWDRFQEYLPEANSGVKCLAAKPELKLLPLEREIWNLADGSMSLKAIAKTTQESIETIQVNTLRLILLGLLEETFILVKN